MRIGVIADTHGLLRPDVKAHLAGCDRILHAGDVGVPEVLAELAGIAPVVAVRGNVDTGGTLATLPESWEGELDGLAVAMTHRREDVDPAWVRRCRLVVFGHSHRPEVTWQGSCLLLNPGACGRRRFHLPLTLAILSLVQGRLTPEILSLEDDP